MTPPPRRPPPPRTSPRNDPRHALGRAGEAAVAAHYERAGFIVLARNLRTTRGELDLVLRRGALLVAVEVKTRRAHAAPERLVDDAEIARRGQALAAVARPLVPSVRRLRLRIDVAAVRWCSAAAAEIR